MAYKFSFMQYLLFAVVIIILACAIGVTIWAVTKPGNTSSAAASTSATTTSASNEPSIQPSTSSSKKSNFGISPPYTRPTSTTIKTEQTKPISLTVSNQTNESKTSSITKTTLSSTALTPTVTTTSKKPISPKVEIFQKFKNVEKQKLMTTILSQDGLMMSTHLVHNDTGASSILIHRRKQLKDAFTSFSPQDYIQGILGVAVSQYQNFDTSSDGRYIAMGQSEQNNGQVTIYKMNSTTRLYDRSYTIQAMEGDVSFGSRVQFTNFGSSSMDVKDEQCIFISGESDQGRFIDIYQLNEGVLNETLRKTRYQSPPSENQLNQWAFGAKGIYSNKDYFIVGLADNFMVFDKSSNTFGISILNFKPSESFASSIWISNNGLLIVTGNPQENVLHIFRRSQVTEAFTETDIIKSPSSTLSAFGRQLISDKDEKYLYVSSQDMISVYSINLRTRDLEEFIGKIWTPSKTEHVSIISKNGADIVMTATSSELVQLSQGCVAC